MLIVLPLVAYFFMPTVPGATAGVSRLAARISSAFFFVIRDRATCNDFCLARYLSDNFFHSATEAYRDFIELCVTGVIRRG